MHLDGAGAKARRVIVELHVRMIGKQRHGNGRVNDAFRNHQGRETLSKRIVVNAQCLTSPWPPCITAQRAVCQLAS